MKNYLKSGAKASPKLKLLKSSSRQQLQQDDDPPMKAGGLAPTPDMQPGVYIAVCEGAKRDPKFGNNDNYKFLWRIVEGPHAGTGLSQWEAVELFKGRVNMNTKYGKQCMIALDGEVEPGDDLRPNSVFAGKTFKVDVGYWKTPCKNGKRGGQADDKLKLTRKSDDDYLRVHEVLERCDVYEAE